MRVSQVTFAKGSAQRSDFSKLSALNPQLVLAFGSVDTLRAGAAAIADKDHVARVAAFNKQWRGWLTQEIRRLGLRVDDSAANFVLVHFAPGAKDAKAADAFLTSRGVILRAVAAYGLPDALRLTIGTEEANRAVVAALKDFVA